MNPATIQKAEAIFEEAVALDGVARAKFLDERCDDDQELRSFVELLIQNHAQGMGSFLDTPMIDFSGSDCAQPAGMPARIGRYEIVRMIGEGGMGAVYEARQENPRRNVALKVIRPGLSHVSLMRRFQFEAQVLARLQHPHIAQIFEAGVAPIEYEGQNAPATASVAFFAMEYIEGSSLGDFATKNRLSVHERLDLLRQICEAVHYAHQKGIIHRDLKPANILVMQGTDVWQRHGGIRQGRTRRHEGNSGAVTGNGEPKTRNGRVRGSQSAIRNPKTAMPKVLDFGVARATDGDLAVTAKQTVTGQIIGTLSYMSPEQISGDPNAVDVRSDVYALGVLAYELLSGRTPLDLEGKSLVESARIIAEVEPAPLRKSNAALDVDLEAIVAKALEKEPARRYASASELAADIDRYLSNQPIMARPASTLYQIRKFVARNKTPSALAASLLVALVGFAVIATVQAGRIARQRDRAVAAESTSADRFDQVRELAHTFIFDVHDEIQNLPGATAARESIVGTALGYLDKLADDAAGDAELLGDLAAGYERIGDVQGAMFEASLGDTQGAEQSFQKSEAILVQLADMATTDNDRAAYRYRWAHLQRKLGDVQFLKRDLGAALERYGHALRTWEALSSNAALGLDALRETTVALNSIARVHIRQGDLDQGIEHHERALQVARQLLKDDPDNINLRNDEAHAIDAIAAVLVRKGALDQALEKHRLAFDIRRELAELDPNNVERQDRVASCHISIGDCLRGKDQTREALEHYQASLEIRRLLADADADNAEARKRLQVSLERVGDTMIAAGRLDEALDVLEESLSLAKRSAAKDPSNLPLQRALSVAHEKIGNLFNQQGEIDDALEHAMASLRIRRVIAEADLDSAESQRDLAVGYYKLGTAHHNNALLESRTQDEQLRSWCQARAAYRQAIECVDEMIERDILAASDAGVRPMLQERLADCDEALAGSPCVDPNQQTALGAAQ